jgi:Zn finger protein HypA/HybF involved in hydrogenase expression
MFKEEPIIEYPRLNSDGKLFTVYQKKYFICTKCSEIILSATVKHVCRECHPYGFRKDER